MKSKTQLPWTALASVLFVLMGALLFPTESPAGDASWWGSSAWWDWSDFRGAIGSRVFLARLAAASITIGGKNFDLKNADYGFDDEPEPFKEFWAELYIDRLGLRFNVADYAWRGTPAGSIGTPNGPLVAELRFGMSSLGVDLDLVRFPFLRLGIDYDYQVNAVKFLDLTGALYTSDTPMTLGVHGRAIPFRFREIPFTVQARFHFPMPFLNRQAEAKVTDWEISGGLRPAIWETSLYGHATFSFDIEAGYRSVNLDSNLETMVTQPQPFIDPNTGNITGWNTTLPPPSMSLKARWNGAFIQVGLFF
ncbi:MAG: hypothetical protein WBG50_16275 [Desulfomonilaceae bacterium]